MRFSSYINNQRCLEWGLNANQGALFDLINQASGWASEIVVDGVVYYWVSRNKVLEELPLFYSTADTVYRHFVVLQEKGLIIYLKQGKHGDKDLIRLTDRYEGVNVSHATIKRRLKKNWSVERALFTPSATHPNKKSKVRQTKYKNNFEVNAKGVELD